MYRSKQQKRDHLVKVFISFAVGAVIITLLGFVQYQNYLSRMSCEVHKVTHPNHLCN